MPEDEKIILAQVKDYYDDLEAGFLEDFEGNQYFFQRADIVGPLRNLRADTIVSFTTEEGVEGLEAKEIRLVR